MGGGVRGSLWRPSTLLMEYLLALDLAVADWAAWGVSGEEAVAE